MLFICSEFVETGLNYGRFEYAHGSNNNRIFFTSYPIKHLNSFFFHRHTLAYLKLYAVRLIRCSNPIVVFALVGFY